MSVTMLSGIGRWPFGVPIPGPYGLLHPAYYVWWAEYWMSAQRNALEDWLYLLDRLEEARSEPDTRETDGP
ncbi:MAG: hypothetical protein AAF414_09415 [Pseudomonadota bacterium]